MTGERASHEISSLHLDIKNRRVLATLEDQSVLHFTLTPDLRLFYDGRFGDAASPEATTRQEILQQPQAPEGVVGTAQATEAPRTPEKQPIQTLTGRVMQDVQPGRVDGRGNPTAWTIAAVHDAGNDQAKLVAISFHRHTMQQALDHLRQGDQITIQGYLRPAAPPKPGEKPRLDNFSAFHLINYPGKGSRQP